MKNHPAFGYLMAGFAAGTVAGLFGAGGGLVLVPLLSLITPTQEAELFPTSLSVILLVCLVSVAVTALTSGIAWKEAFPYLFGSAAGGIGAGLWGNRIPVLWLHRALGILILWGGIRSLC